jgi:hypothetical protein
MYHLHISDLSDGVRNTSRLAVLCAFKPATGHWNRRPPAISVLCQSGPSAAAGKKSVGSADLEAMASSQIDIGGKIISPGCGIFAAIVELKLFRCAHRHTGRQDNASELCLASGYQQIIKLLMTNLRC